MNILLLSNHFDIGGISNYLLNLAIGLKKSGHSVIVLSGGGGMAERLAQNGIEHLTLPIRTKQEFGLKVVAAIPKIRSIVKQKNIQIIHSNSRVTQVLASAAAALTGARHVTTYHGFFRNVVARRLFPFMGDRVIAISEPVRDYLTGILKVDPKDVALIYNGIDAGHFSKAFSPEEKLSARKAYGLRADSVVVGIIARLSTVKGHPDLIKAFAEISKENKNVECLIIGEGGIKDDLVSLAKSLGVEKAVRFVDSVADTRIPLSVMDIFAMPSLMEGFGLAILEAMAAGKAVVGTEIGGITDLIENGKNGILVKPSHPEELAAAIKKLAGDAPLRKRLGESARTTAKEKFPIEKTVENTIKTYASVLK